MGQDLALLFHKAAELLDAELGHQELDAGAVAVAFFAQAGKNAGHRLHLRQDLIFCRELAKHLRLVGHSAQAATHEYFEAPLALAVHLTNLGQITEIVHHHQAAGFAFTAGKGRLELTAKILHIVVAEQELGIGVGIRRCVEDLCAADTGQVAAGYVADRVATCFARGDADGGQTTHHVRRIFDMHKMQLDILAGGYMQNAVRVFVSDLREHVKLLRRQAAVGHFDALHTRRVPERIRPFETIAILERQFAALEAVMALAVVVALPVDAPPQTGFGEDLFVQFPLAHQLHLAFENVDLVGQISRHLFQQDFLPTDVRHSGLLAYVRFRRHQERRERS